MMMKALTETLAGSPVGRPVAHESAPLHVTGKARYVDDLPELAGTLYAAIGQSTCARGQLVKLDLDAVKAYPGVRCVLTAQDIPGENNCGPVLHDDPLLATDEVLFYGQVLFVVAADTREAAREAVRLAKVDYAAATPILDIDAAVAAESWVLPPFSLERGAVADAFGKAPHTLKGKASVGGQEHFYLEGQISYAQPREDQSLHVICSTQHPSEMQVLIGHCLGWHAHQISVECRRMGGAFGGKESQSAQWACLASLLAVRTGCPVKLRLDRDEDMTATGKRHGFQYEWESAFDDEGRILGVKLTMASNCGYSADLSGSVNDRAICHIDNAYYLDAVSLRSLRCKTNTVSNTAFRGFGGPQGMFFIESAVDDIARYLGIDPLQVRQRNFYASEPGGARATTHYGMPVNDNVAPALVTQLADDCNYAARREAIAEFNQHSPVIKRGLALTPVKFGISFNATHLNQAGALVHVYTDGTVLVSHGGTEMGQGLYTKIRQVVAHEFGLALESVRLAATDTSKVANTSATAASSGSDLNGKAAQAACQNIKIRLAAFVVDQCQGKIPAAGIRFENGRVQAGPADAPLFDQGFPELVMSAYRARIQLWDSGFYRTPKIHFDPLSKLGRPFYYFAYGAAATEVAIDTLTGETRVLRTDILHDAGRSINPALDIGQIEGGFVQGMGWLTSEELWWRTEGPQAGRLMTHAPSTYKIPTASDVPEVFNVRLYDNANVEDSIHRSKAVGEPPFMLALSVFFAIRDAVAACLPAGQAVALSAPATPEAILRAIQHGVAPLAAQRLLEEIADGA
jgi:xanthine dehydrogenase large subunit